MTTPLEYQLDGQIYRGQLAKPTGAGPFPGVLVMHDGQGVGPFVCARAEALARLGYIALAADMFGEGKQPKDGDGASTVIALRKQGELLRSRVLAGYEALCAVPEVKRERIGAIGYCFGGQCVLELARSSAEAKAVVSFHGTLGTLIPAKPGAVKAKMLVLTGALDPYAPAEDRAAFEREMTEAGADWQMTIYSSAKHGFTDPIADQMRDKMPGVGYDRLIDRLSWAQATSFLDLLLRA